MYRVFAGVEAVHARRLPRCPYLRELEFGLEFVCFGQVGAKDGSHSAPTACSDSVN